MEGKYDVFISFSLNLLPERLSEGEDSDAETSMRSTFLYANLLGPLKFHGRRSSTVSSPVIEWLQLLPPLLISAP